MKKLTEDRPYDFKYPAIGKILIRVPIVMESPIIIGSGESENSDLDILRESPWPSGSFGDETTFDTYVIPATSIVGAIRAWLTKVLSQKEHADSLEMLFGDEQCSKAQSALACEDVFITPETPVRIRDGVKIDAAANTAEDRALFNYEVLETRRPITLNFELTLRHRRADSAETSDPDKTNLNSEDCLSLFRLIIKGIDDGHIRLGAKTNKGFGRMSVKKTEVQIVHLDFSDPDALSAWINEDYPWQYLQELSVKKIAISYQRFEIEAFFQIKNSLLIKSYDSQPDMPDAVSVANARNEKIIPGPSLMGAIRHRALKILNTLDWPDADESIYNLFGFVYDKDSSHPFHEKMKQADIQARRGRIEVEETIIRSHFSQVQSRIRIDRFTGSVVTGALFDAMPVWQKAETDYLSLRFAVSDYQPWEAGLMLAILKDLWTGDLAIGGEKSIGRGVLLPYQPVAADKMYAAKITWPEDNKVFLRLGEDGRPSFNQPGLDKLAAFTLKPRR